MFCLSNTLLRILNIVTFLLSIPIMWAGVWLRHKGDSACEPFFDTVLIVLGVFVMVLSITGLISTWSKSSCPLFIYLGVMYLLIIVLLFFTIFAFTVTDQGAGVTISEGNYKEYRLEDYSNWLRKRVESTKKWNKIKSCLHDSKVCSKFNDAFINDNVQEFHKEELSAIESGCCKPSNDCGFTYKNPISWTKTNTNSTNSDCTAWDNDTNVLCYNCNSCKAGLLDTLQKDWKKVAVIYIVFQIFLIIPYYVGCRAFRNNVRDFVAPI